MTEVILNAVCKYYKVTREDLAVKKGRRQKMAMAKVKQVATFLLYKHNKPITYLEIAMLLGYKKKQNAHFARVTTRRIASGDRAFKEEIEAIEKTFLRD